MLAGVLTGSRLEVILTLFALSLMARGVDTPPVAINYNRPVQFSSIDESSWSSRTTSHNTIIRSACVAHTVGALVDLPSMVTVMSSSID